MIIESLQVSLREGGLTPQQFRSALLDVPARDRDTFVDTLLEFDVPDDSAALPKGCVPYLPCAVDALLDVVTATKLGPTDVLVDVGSGVGRALAVLHLLSGAKAIGIEVQPDLVRSARAVRTRFPSLDLETIEAEVHGALPVRGSVYFAYCPFSGARFEAFVDSLQSAGPFRLACVDVTHLPRPWLETSVVGAVQCSIRR